MRVDQPQPGLYKMRFKRGAPWLPVHIWTDHPVDPETLELLDRPALLRCTVANEERDPYDIWSWCAGNPIDREEYRYLGELLKWSDELGQDRGKPYDLSTMPGLY